MAVIWGYELDVLLDIRPEELAAVVLVGRSPGDKFHPGNVVLDSKTVAETGGATPDEAQRFSDAVAVACRWLENEGYVVLDPAVPSGWQRVTDRATSAPPAPTRRSRPRYLDDFNLSPALASAVDNYLRGDMDGAVTLAMKAVEVVVRDSAGAASSDIGLNLMKKVFRPRGLLADPRLGEAQNIGRSQFYEGLIGWWRNIAGHRAWPTTEEQYVAQMLMTADIAIRVAEQAAIDKAASWPKV